MVARASGPTKIRLRADAGVVDHSDVNNTVAPRIGIQFFVAAAFLAVFGLLSSSQDASSLIPTLVVAAACAGAGFAVRTGTTNGRPVGLLVAAGTVAYAVVSLFCHHDLPGSIIATFAAVRLASAGAARLGRCRPHRGPRCRRTSSPGAVPPAASPKLASLRLAGFSMASRHTTNRVTAKPPEPTSAGDPGFG